MKTAMAICATLIVAGCASSTTLPTVGALPVDYRQLAVDHVRDHFPDASKIRSAQIAQISQQPPVGAGLAEAGQSEYLPVCLRTKAKGSSRAKDTVLFIRGNQVMDAEDGVAAANFCKGAQFEPFPEIVNMKPSANMLSPKPDASKS